MNTEPEFHPLEEEFGAAETKQKPKAVVLPPVPFPDPAKCTAAELKPHFRALLDVTSTDRRANIEQIRAHYGVNLISDNAVKDFINEATWKNISRAKVFCCGHLGYLLFPGREGYPVPVSSEEPLFTELMEEYGLANSATKNAAGEYVGSKCETFGIHTDARVGTYYNDKGTTEDLFGKAYKAYSAGPTAYFTHQRGRVLRITRRGVTDEPNGVDNELFLYPPGFKPFNIDLTPDPEEYERWRASFPAAGPVTLGEPRPIQPTSNKGPKLPKIRSVFEPIPGLLDNVRFKESSYLTREEKVILVTALVLVQLLPGITAGRVLLLLFGKSGSGKTFLIRVLGRMLVGPDFEVTGPDADIKEMENKMVNTTFVGMDDVDYLDNDKRALVRRAVTGGKLVRRELYTTMGQVEKPYTASLGISAISNIFHEEEMANRILALGIEKHPKYVDEKQLLKKIDDQRDELMGHLIVRIWRVLLLMNEKRRGYAPAVTNRMASFATFILQIADGEDWDRAKGVKRPYKLLDLPVKAVALLDHWRQEQEQSVFESGNPLAEAIEWWLKKLGVNLVRGAAGMRASELYTELCPYVQNQQTVPYEFKSVEAMARSLQKSEDAFARRFGFRCSRPSPTKTFKYYLAPSAEQLKALDDEFELKPDSEPDSEPESKPDF